MSSAENLPLKYLQSFSDAEKTIEYCRHFNQNSDIWIQDEHEHTFIELIYFLSGEAQVKTAYGDTFLTLYDVLIHPSNVKHREYVDLHRRQEIIALGVFASTDFQFNESFVLKDNTGNIRRVFLMLDDYFNKSSILHDELVEQLLALLLTYLKMSAWELHISKSKYSMIDNIVEFVHEKYMLPLTVKSLAEHVHVSESYLSRFMTSQIGISPMKYVNHIRIENAKQALKTDISIELLASMVGFSDQKYFSTVFKRETGLSPSEYRKRIILCD